MPLEHQRAARPAAALDDRDDVGPSGGDLDDVVRPAELGEEPAEEVGGRLLDGGGARGVDGPQPDQVLGEGYGGGFVDRRHGVRGQGVGRGGT